VLRDAVPMYVMKAYIHVGQTAMHSFVASAQRGVRGHLHAPAALPSGKEPPVPIEYSILLSTKNNIVVLFDLIPKCSVRSTNEIREGSW
jgi:hypothetical protein